MKALTKTAPGVGNFAITDRPVPTVGPRDVLIRVSRAAVCATDVHLFEDRFANSPPFVLGHEFSGIADSVGNDVESVSPGDRVVSENNPYACGVCKTCVSGHPNLCPHKRAMGIHSDGAFAEYVALPEHLLHVLPESVSLRRAVLSEPLAVAVHAVWNRAGVDSGDVVVVMGAGAIGLLAAQVARAEGASSVIVVGTDADEPARFDVARNLGFHTVNVQRQSLPDVVGRSTDDLGVDLVVEASGSPAAVTDAVRIVRRAGRITVSGITGLEAISVGWDALIAKGATLTFSYSSLRTDWDEGLRLLSSGQIDTEALLTDELPLEEWPRALELLRTKEAVRPCFKIGPT
jgi:L-iditol 2-dehydrogenase